MRNFYHVLTNTLLAGITTNFVWFALTYWAYLETRSVLATSFAGGSYFVAAALSGIWFGSIVDHHKKKIVMQLSSIITLTFFALGLLIYNLIPGTSFQTIESVPFWIFIFLLLLGVIAGNLRNITLPTLVTLLVPEDKRDKANGMSGTIFGIIFGITSVVSGIILAWGGIQVVLIISLIFTLLALLHLSYIDIPEKNIVHAADKPIKVDLKGTIKAIKDVPGLFALIFFTTFNNFLGGAFMSLMDAYGLSLVSVQVWGILWGVLSLGFILGGLYVAKYGLGRNPVNKLFKVNIVLWIISTFFTIQPSIILLAAGIFLWLCLSPFVEAIEQTIIQKVVPLERQGRVFGFAHSVEQAASPITAFIIGPIAQYVFIPFMTTGAGVNLIGSWYGIGIGRGIALVFSFTGIIGLIVTLFAMRSPAYRQLSERYEKQL